MRKILIAKQSNIEVYIGTEFITHAGLLFLSCASDAIDRRLSTGAFTHFMISK
jgi:hypothetical protein